MRTPFEATSRRARRTRHGCSELIRSRTLAACALLVLMSLAGCAHRGSTFDPADIVDETRALVMVYRPARLSNAILSPSVVVDGEAVFSTENGTYAYLYLEPGLHRFVLQSEQHIVDNNEVEIRLESGRLVYLRVDTALQFETGKPYTRRFGLKQVEEWDALKEIAHCRDQRVRLPAKYPGSAGAHDRDTDETRPDGAATFTIDKSNNPFASKRSRE